MANLPLSFAELLVGAVVLDAAIKGDSITNVIKGVATQHPITGNGSSGGGGSTGGSGANSIPAGTYTNPVPGATTGRVDQGVDYTLSSKGYIAPGNSKIVYIGSGGGWGAEYVAGQLLDGPLKGAVWYIAEASGIASGITKGATVKAGQQITPGNATIEAGWANPSNPGQTLAQSLSGYGGDQSSQALTSGYSFSTFVTALGGAAGTFEGAGMSLATKIKQEFTGSAIPSGVPYG